MSNRRKIASKAKVRRARRRRERNVQIDFETFSTFPGDYHPVMMGNHVHRLFEIAVRREDTPVVVMSLGDYYTGTVSDAERNQPHFREDVERAQAIVEEMIKLHRTLQPDIMHFERGRLMVGDYKLGYRFPPGDDNPQLRLYQAAADIKEGVT